MQPKIVTQQPTLSDSPCQPLTLTWKRSMKMEKEMSHNRKLPNSAFTCSRTAAAATVHKDPCDSVQAQHIVAVQPKGTNASIW